MTYNPNRLLIDDVRNEYNVGCSLGAIARNYWTGVECLRIKTWDIVYLDHDLHSYDESGREWTGYHVMCFLEENPQFLPKDIICVSSNPSGRARIEQVIEKLYGRKPNKLGAIHED